MHAIMMITGLSFNASKIQLNVTAVSDTEQTLATTVLVPFGLPDAESRAAAFMAVKQGLSTLTGVALANIQLSTLS